MDKPSNNRCARKPQTQLGVPRKSDATRTRSDDLVDDDSFMERRQGQVKALIEQGNLTEADRLCQEGLEHFPGHALLWELLAGIEEARGNTEAAERTRNAAIEANREMRNLVGDHPALDAVEVILLGKAGRLEETTIPIERLQEAGYDHPLYWSMLGGEHYQNQRFLEARKAFERAHSAATNDGMRELALQGLALLVDLRTNFLERCQAMGADPVESLRQGGDEESVRYVREVLLAGDLGTPLEFTTVYPRDPDIPLESYRPYRNPIPEESEEEPPTPKYRRTPLIAKWEEGDDGRLIRATLTSWRDGISPVAPARNETGTDQHPMQPAMDEIESDLQRLSKEAEAKYGKVPLQNSQPESAENDSLPDALTERVMKKYGFTRDEAEQALKDFGE